MKLNKRGLIEKLLSSKIAQDDVKSKIRALHKGELDSDPYKPGELYQISTGVLITHAYLNFDKYKPGLIFLVLSYDRVPNSVTCRNMAEEKDQVFDASLFEILMEKVV